MNRKQQFFQSLWAVDSLVATEPTSGTFHQLAPLLRDRDIYREFWQLLSRPDWIEPLEGGGYFAPPIYALTQPGKPGSQEPWAASQFLVRMATDNPKLVTGILSKIDTNNPSILGDMVQATMKMPIGDAAPLLQRVARILDKGTELYAFHQRDLLILIKKLWESPAQSAVAFHLARTYLFPKVKAEGVSQRREEYNFFEALEALIPLMTKLRPEETVRCLCTRLVEAIGDKDKLVRAEEPTLDYSFMWRPAIEEHEQNSTYDFAGRLVSPLRNASEQAIGEERVTLDKVLRKVRGYRFLIFRRLAVHLINVFAEENRELACSTMMQKRLFDDTKYKHEYAMLVGRRFNLLDSQHKDRYFNWVHAGPDMAGFDDRIESNVGRGPTEEERRG
ncbi:hypothetical protein LCGC14_2694040, partial [marine sediment metagenome]